ncbi:MAG: hypothetical protein KDC38_07345 [Planctomycetes bacterium]|nr:hypothetical protein [Planctomycetota bacterium]
MRAAIAIVFALLIAFAVAPTARGDQIVQSGSLSGFGAPAVQDLILDQFDDQGGTLALNFVQLDFLTSTSGGFTTDGSGIAVDILSRLTADYSLGSDLLAETEALIQMTVPNPAGTPPFAASVFDTDTAQAQVTGAQLAPWVGAGDVTLSVFTEFVVSETPAGVIGFGAGGTVQYTVTYDYDLAPDDLLSRGDSNGDGLFDIADAIFSLATLFIMGSPDPGCLDAADANDDGVFDISDAIYTLSALFTAGPPPPAPHPECGIDETGDLLGCAEPGICP